jgi:hypothetical protein
LTIPPSLLQRADQVIARPSELEPGAGVEPATY